MIYFTSDTHLGHKNLVAGCSKWGDLSQCRDFQSIEDHDNCIIDNINSTVRKNDTLFHLGDFCISSNIKLVEYRKRIKCSSIHLILGNHDEAIRANKKHHVLFSSISEYKKISMEKQCIVLCHYSMRVWEKSHYGSWMLFGHSHGNLDVTNAGRTMDVGVDPNNFSPISFNGVREKMATIKHVSFDHHGSV